MKILTFNHHESFLCSLAQTGFQFDVVTKVQGLDLSWSKNARAVPDNFNLVEFDDAVKQRVRDGYYDWIVCHTVMNLIWLWFFRRQNFIFVAHIPLFFTSFGISLKSIAKKIAFVLFRLTHQTQFVAVSEFKRRFWSEDGEVIVLAPRPLLPSKVEPDYKHVYLVANKIEKRGEELGWDFLRPLLDKIPLTIIGDNPGLENARVAKDFEEFSQLFSRAKIYLFTIRFPFGDGYNTAMLEAMNQGMAIVSLPNPSSPIVHGENGLVAGSPSELCQMLEQLLSDQALVDRLGAAAQKTVQQKFSEKKFIDSWKRLLSGRRKEVELVESAKQNSY